MSYLKSPFVLIILLMAGITAAFSQSVPLPLDDHFNYQRFIETLASGHLDLSIPGFHGSDFLAVIFYWVFPSSIAQIQFQIFAAMLLPLCAYAASTSLFKKMEERILFTSSISLLPFVLFVGLRGWTGAAYWDLMLLSIAAAPAWPYAAGVLLALAILTKPFAIALLPLVYVLQPGKRYIKKRPRLAYITIGICALYVCIQLSQTGRILIGSHTDVNHLTVWQGPKRIFLNLAHAVQILFSVHNYYYPDPSLTGAGNMMHTSPVFVFLGLFALFSKMWQRAKHRALVLGVIIGIGLNALLDHMDHFYMEAGILCLIIASIPLLLKHRIWIPIALATLHFQWFYFYLEYQDPFSLNWAFFLVPAIVDILFVGYIVKNKSEVCATLRAIL